MVSLFFFFFLSLFRFAGGFDIIEISRGSRTWRLLLFRRQVHEDDEEGWVDRLGQGEKGRARQGRMGYDIDTIGNMFMRETERAPGNCNSQKEVI